jgi:hypothetical protein
MTPDTLAALRQAAVDDDGVTLVRSVTLIRLIDALADRENKLAKAREALEHLATPANHGGLVVGQITKMEALAATTLKEITGK